MTEAKAIRVWPKPKPTQFPRRRLPGDETDGDGHPQRHDLSCLLPCVRRCHATNCSAPCLAGCDPAATADGLLGTAAGTAAGKDAGTAADADVDVGTAAGIDAGTGTSAVTAASIDGGYAATLMHASQTTAADFACTVGGTAQVSDGTCLHAHMHTCTHARICKGGRRGG